MTGACTPEPSGEALPEVVVVSVFRAGDIADRLAVLEDWLLHASSDTLAELGQFAFSRTRHPEDEVTTLVDALGGRAAWLHDQLTPSIAPAHTTAPAATTPTAASSFSLEPTT